MKSRKIILYIMIALILGITAYLVFTFFSNYANNTYIDGNMNNTNNTVADNVVEADFIELNGYIYFIPEGIYYNMDDIDNIDTIHLNTANGEWGAFIELVDKNEQAKGIFNDYDALEKLLVDTNNYKAVKNRKVINKNDIEVVSFEISTDVNNNLMAYMPAYENYEYQILLFSGDRTTFDYEALNKVVDIISSAVKAAD